MPALRTLTGNLPRSPRMQSRPTEEVSAGRLRRTERRGTGGARALASRTPVRSWRPPAAGTLAVCAMVAPAHAVVREPNGLQGPIPVGPAEIGFASGFNPPAVVTLKALFDSR